MTAAADDQVAALVAAMRDPSEEHKAAARDKLAEGVEVFSPFGVGTGVDAAQAMLTDARVVGIGAGADWTDPVVDGDLVVVTAPLPAGPIGGFRFSFRFDDDGRVDRIEHDLLPSSPATPRLLALTDQHAELLANGLPNGAIPIVAYVDAGGAPHQSYRATVQVFDDQSLALWIRDPSGGLLKALPTNPHVSVFFSDRSKGVNLQFHGRGRVDESDAVREQVYAASPRAEQDMDWRRRGVAVVIELDRVEGRDPSGPVLMARG